jgi:hypothetical protein
LCVLLGISYGYSVAFTAQYLLASYVHEAREVLDLRPKTAFAHVGVKKAGRRCSAICGVLEVAFPHHQAYGLGFATDMLV